MNNKNDDLAIGLKKIIEHGNGVNDNHEDINDDDIDEDITIGEILADLPLPTWISKNYQKLKDRKLIESGVKVVNSTDNSKHFEGKCSYES